MYVASSSLVSTGSLNYLITRATKLLGSSMQTRAGGWYGTVQGSKIPKKDVRTQAAVQHDLLDGKSSMGCPSGSRCNLCMCCQAHCHLMYGMPLRTCWHMLFQCSFIQVLYSQQYQALRMDRIVLMLFVTTVRAAEIVLRIYVEFCHFH